MVAQAKSINGVKVLLLCLRVPWPLNDGGNLAMMNMAELLQQSGHDVTIFALNTKKHFVPTDQLPPIFKNGIRLITVPIDTSIKFTGALLNLFRPNESYNVIRFHAAAAEKRLGELLQQESFDIIQLESIFTSTYIPVIRKHTAAPVVLRAHNIEHIIWKRLSETSQNPIRQLYLRFLSKRLKKFEEQFFKNVDGLLPISPVDGDFLRQYASDVPQIVIPMGINPAAYPVQLTTDLKLFHLGAMDWLPNREGVAWFLEKCWPAIHAQHAQLPLYLAGRGFPKELMEKSLPMVSFSGTVDDAQYFMQDKQIMLVPLHSGSGLRIKILQGLALGKTIISTTIGAEGISVTDGINILLADSPEEFLEKINYCIENPDRCRAIGLEGRKLIEKKYANEVLSEKVSDFYRKLLA